MAKVWLVYKCDYTDDGSVRRVESVHATEEGAKKKEAKLETEKKKYRWLFDWLEVEEENLEE